MKSPLFARRALFLAALVLPFLSEGRTAHAQEANAVPANNAVKRFDFGGANTEPGYITVGPELRFSLERGYGWLSTEGLLSRERTAPEGARRDFIFGKNANTFRINNLKPGHYRLSITSGDTDYGDHITRVAVGGGPALPLLEPALGEFVTLTTSVEVPANTLDIVFDSPNSNWIVNIVSLEATTALTAPTLERQKVAPVPQNSWANVAAWPDPTKALLESFRPNAQAMPDFKPTGLSRSDYLKIIAGEVDFWKGHQDANGAIIDPYRKVEWQYSTPAYAHAAAALVAWDNRRDLLESAAKAMDWATRTLSERKAATAHEDFYAPMLAHALPLLKPFVTAERSLQWEADIRRFEPLKTYRAAPGGNNWNLVAAAGEGLFQQMGLRNPEDKFVELSLAAQGQHFGSPYGLYLEGPMAYDHFPRLWAADLTAHNYDGPYHSELSEVLRRGAITSLFMQSPWGELPAGGRSAHHQWNEAEQCVTYEVFAAQALKAGDAQLAGIYKRAAHLALASMRRWVRPSGEMQIIKNWVDPAQSHAFEGYSAHSQYNLLPMSMLAIAYHHAEATNAVNEQPAPADNGGYVLEIADLHKIFANAGGTYVEIETSADHHYDATGLIRVHIKGVSPQLGPSDSIVNKPAYRIPADSASTPYAGVGVAWKGADGTWHRVGELDRGTIEKTTLANVVATPQRVSFDVIYQGKMFGVSRLVEHYALTPGKVELTTTLDGYTGPLRYVWPVLADDGRVQSNITVDNNTVTVSQDGGKTAQTFTAIGADTVRVEAERYANHNGWARLGVAEYARAAPITLQIMPRILP